MDKLGILQLCKSSGKPIRNVFAEYVYHMFNFDSKSLGQINKSHIEKIENFGKSFDQLTKETVKAFLIDSKKSKFKI